MVLPDAVDDGSLWPPVMGKMGQVLETGAPPLGGAAFWRRASRSCAAPGRPAAGPNLLIGHLFAGPHQSIQFTAQGDGIAVHGIFLSSVLNAWICFRVSVMGVILCDGDYRPCGALFYHCQKGIQPFLPVCAGGAFPRFPCGS
jgi:hypothetical protein